MANVKIMMSNHHVHLSKEVFETLFGTEHQLVCKNEIGAGEFASEDVIAVEGPKGRLENVRVMGPVRSFTQAELLEADCIRLGVSAPLRDSGDVEGSAELKLIGPLGEAEVNCGILAQRHIHMTTALSHELGIADRQMVSVQVDGPKGVTYHNVLVRTVPRDKKSALMHIDLEEGNGAGLKNGTEGTILL